MGENFCDHKLSRNQQTAKAQASETGTKPKRKINLVPTCRTGSTTVRKQLILDNNLTNSELQVERTIFSSCCSLLWARALAAAGRRGGLKYYRVGLGKFAKFSPTETTTDSDQCPHRLKIESDTVSLSQTSESDSRVTQTQSAKNFVPGPDRRKLRCCWT